MQMQAGGNSIASGDLVALETPSGDYTGVFTGWQGAFLSISTANGTVLIPQENVSKLTILATTGANGAGARGVATANITADSPGGQNEISVSYLLRGPVWFASYELELNTSMLKCWAYIKNPEDWQGVMLSVVAGGPHVVGNSYSYSFCHKDKSLATTTTASGTEPSTTPPPPPPPPPPSPPAIYPSYCYDPQRNIYYPISAGECYQYSVSENAKLYKGESLKMPLFNGVVGLTEFWYWESRAPGYNCNDYYSGAAEFRSQLANTLDFPLPSGIVEAYRGTLWAGEDVLEYTMPGEETYLTLHVDNGVTLESTMVDLEYETHGYIRHVRIDVKISSYRSPLMHTIRIIQTLSPTSTLNSSSPACTQDEDMLVWDLDLFYYTSYTIEYRYFTP
jgi:hypothetical protein